MGCNESVNVNFSDKSYQVNMFIYICYEMCKKSAEKDLDIKEQYENLEQIRCKMTRKDKYIRNNDKHLVKIPSDDI